MTSTREILNHHPGDAGCAGSFTPPKPCASSSLAQGSSCAAASSNERAQPASPETCAPGIYYACPCSNYGARHPQFDFCCHCNSNVERHFKLSPTATRDFESPALAGQEGQGRPTTAHGSCAVSRDTDRAVPVPFNTPEAHIASLVDIAVRNIQDVCHAADRNRQSISLDAGIRMRERLEDAVRGFRLLGFRADAAIRSSHRHIEKSCAASSPTEDAGASPEACRRFV